jgi:hypothetical protein
VDQELTEAVADFAGSFELIFDEEWEHSKACLMEAGHYIEPDGTFLNPGVADESNNWANRGSLLANYRRLKHLLEARGMTISTGSRQRYGVRVWEFDFTPSSPGGWRKGYG